MIKLVSVSFVVAGIAIYAVAVSMVSQKIDLDYSFGAFSCLGSICKTKTGVLPVAWRRYGQYKDRFVWD